MSNELEIILPLVAVVLGVGLTAFIFGGIFKLIRTAIESRSKSNLPDNVVSMKDFIEYKLKVEKRIQTLEALLVDQDLIDKKKLEARKDRLDIGTEFEADAEGANLRNRLKN